METHLGSLTAAGFAAQLVDGSLGMGYGVICSTLLLSIGLAPAIASASVHIAQVFTTATSAYFHFKAGNVDIAKLKRLAIPGAAGGAAGACFLCHVPGHMIKPWVALYLLAMGSVILVRSVRPQLGQPGNCRLLPLGLVGGIVDAIGGGGWGPVVTSSLVARGHNPRYSIGTANAAEFFVALTTSVTFLITLGTVYVPAVAGLVLGGMFAAPFAVKVCKVVQPRPMMVAVGTLIIFLSMGTIWHSVSPGNAEPTRMLITASPAVPK